jgi:pimeloyl-ACP methyl ester carboxylesterase
MPLTIRLLAAGACGLVLAGSAVAPAGAAPAGAPVRATAATSATEARRVGAVPTPQLKWSACYGYAQCATAKVPLDYDQPRGEQTTIALLRVRATDQAHKIGSLFVNPGGPGASATTLALAAPDFLSESVLARFDVVGVDPRGIGAGANVACFTSTAEQDAALAGMNVSFPVGAKQTKAYLKSAGKLATACSTTGRKLAGAMSTAEVARDMEVMRRAVGDSKLTYLGFSYGTALGQYYATMFPDRFRALVVDGVIDPVSWVGTAKTRTVIQDERLRSADGAYKALIRVLRLCDRAGEARCAFAAGDPVKRFAALARRLKAHPVTVSGTSITYADFVGITLSALYGVDAGEQVTAMAADLYRRTSATAGAAWLERARAASYDNSLDSYAAVMCTDGRHPAKASSWPTQAAAADKRAPYFGQLWAWASVPCARNIWKVRDEDAWTGPFTVRTEHPVLVVGSFWDPATNYDEAVSSARRLPNSRLLSSDNFGHTAYGTSACVTTAIDDYLLTETLPDAGTTCTGVQPFTAALDEVVTEAVPALDLATATKDELAAHGRPAPDAPKQLPPVGRAF